MESKEEEMESGVQFNSSTLKWRQITCIDKISILCNVCIEFEKECQNT